MESVALGGTVVQVGLGEDKCCIPAMQAVFKEVHFTGSCKHSQCSCPALPCPALPCPALPCPALPDSAIPRSALHCPTLPCPYLCVSLQQIAAEHARSNACSLQQYFHLTHDNPLSCNVCCCMIFGCCLCASFACAVLAEGDHTIQGSVFIQRCFLCSFHYV